MNELGKKCALSENSRPDKACPVGKAFIQAGIFVGGGEKSLPFAQIRVNLKVQQRRVLPEIQRVVGMAGFQERAC